MRQIIVVLACVAAVLAFLSSALFGQSGAAVAIVIPQKGKVRERVLTRGGAMAQIPGGAFEMGTDASEIPRLQELFGITRADLFSSEVPRHRVVLSPFLLDRFEVTNARFKKFLDRHPRWRPRNISPRLHNGNYLKHWGGDVYPEGKADHPVVNVSWYAAVSFCRWAGGRLPTEAEWEHAARGGLEGRAFPWGDRVPDKSRANFSESGVGGTSAVGSYAPNGYGLYDMAGNVWEYTTDEWGAYPATRQINPVAGGNLFPDDTFLAVTTRRVIRGGSYGGAPVNLRVRYRDSHPPEGAQPFVGFRCARPAPMKRKRSGAPAPPSFHE